MNQRFRSTISIALLASAALFASCENDASRPDPAGEAIVAGADATSGVGFILDERGGWSRQDLAFGAMSFASSGNTLRLAGTAALEATFSSARINRLAEAPDGSIWAAGAWLIAEGDVERPAIWKRGG